MINRKVRSLPKRKTPVEKLVEDSYDEVMGTEDFEEDGYEDYAESEYYAEAPSSFQSRKPQKESETKYRKRYIIRSTVVDKFTIPRKRVLLTPSMCDTHGCGFDVATKNGFIDWYEVPKRERSRILNALAEHKRIAHNNSENYIIDEKDMPVRWLGYEHGLKGV